MLENAVYLRDSTEMSADPFSDILKFTKAEMLATGSFTAGGPWAIRFPAPKSIKFFAVVRGHCWVRVDGGPEAARFDAGDVGLLTAERAFVLASDLELEPLDAMSVFSGSGRSTAMLGDGGDFEHVGGHVRLDPQSGRLLADVLPPWIHIRAASQEATTFRWLLARLVEERSTHQPGGQLAAEQIAQLLFIQVLRARLKLPELMPAGWLRALGDPRIAPAMRHMHGDPARSWRLDELAKVCAMSRTTFALQFRTVVGTAPLTYLGQWRMHLAERALREETTPVAVIGQSLGYTSESAFSNAFKRVTGRSPRAHRFQTDLSRATVVDPDIASLP
jgi:AraC-like DNA-binding protein